MFKHKSLLVVAFAFTVSFYPVLFNTNQAQAQPGINQIILASRKSRPRTTPRTRTTPKPKPHCTHELWGCLNLNFGANTLFPFLGPATAFPREPKPECKDRAWACPILSPQGNTSASDSATIDSTEPKPECKDSAWACPILSPQGNSGISDNTNSSHSSIRGITRPELNNVTSAVAIKKLEALKTSGQATNDDYLLLGYFYSLEKKYDLSEANYLKALELATDDARKAIIEQELEKVRAAMREPELRGNTKVRLKSSRSNMP